MNRHRWLQAPGVRRGALVHGVAFLALAVVWQALEPSPAGTRTADTGAMALLAPLVFLMFAAVTSALAVLSSVLGAFAGYWAARTRSPLAGALAGLAVAALAAALVATFVPGVDVAWESAWLARMKWLAPPAVVAGIVVGLAERGHRQL